MYSRELDLLSLHPSAGESSHRLESQAPALMPPCPAPADPGSQWGAQQARLVLSGLRLLQLQERRDHVWESPADCGHSLIYSLKILRYIVYDLL